MTANNKEEFFSLLEFELKRIGVENYDEIKGDFEQHFADSLEQGIPEEETAFKLGDVKEIARNYLNLESSRLNSIIARDIENTGKKVSLTKPGQSVPADLSLMSGRDIQNTDCVREYTPEHISEEIYPNRDNSSANVADNSEPDQSSANQNNIYVGTIPDYNANSNPNSNPNDNSNTGTNANPGNTGDTVAEAFNNAGKAVAEAAKVTGQAIAEAFGKNGVKGAVINAGKTTADAVKTAGQNAADAVKKATRKHGYVPTPNDDFRENTNSSRNGTIPEGAADSKGKSGGGFTFESIKGKKPNVNGGKLIGAIIMDLLLWDWIVPLIVVGIVAIFTAGLNVLVQYGIGSINGSINFGYHFISRIFLCIGFCALGGIIMGIAENLVKPLIALIKHIVMLHVKAIYDL